MKYYLAEKSGSFISETDKMDFEKVVRGNLFLSGVVQRSEELVVVVL